MKILKERKKAKPKTLRVLSFRLVSLPHAAPLQTGFAQHFPLVGTFNLSDVISLAVDIMASNDFKKIR